MNWLGYVACFVGVLVVGVILGFLIAAYLLHRSHKAFTEAVTKSPKGK